MKKGGDPKDPRPIILCMPTRENHKGVVVIVNIETKDPKAVEESGIDLFINPADVIQFRTKKSYINDLGMTRGKDNLYVSEDFTLNIKFLT